MTTKQFCLSAINPTTNDMFMEFAAPSKTLSTGRLFTSNNLKYRQGGAIF